MMGTSPIGHQKNANFPSFGTFLMFFHFWWLTERHVISCLCLPAINLWEDGRDLWMIFYQYVSIVWVAGTLMCGEDTLTLTRQIDHKHQIYLNLLHSEVMGTLKHCSRALAPNEPPSETCQIWGFFFPFLVLWLVLRSNEGFVTMPSINHVGNCKFRKGNENEDRGEDMDKEFKTPKAKEGKQ